MDYLPIYETSHEIFVNVRDRIYYVRVHFKVECNFFFLQSSIVYIRVGRRIGRTPYLYRSVGVLIRTVGGTFFAAGRRWDV